MLVHEGVRSFQKTMTKYINGDDVVIIEDAKTHREKGVFMPYKLYMLFQDQVKSAIREDIKNSFVEEFDGVAVVGED
ncbi:MAG TPA: hypothetical protein EYG98_06790 [Sulfurovum sp.]|nr:hypothetical protein [Sulfurovum sp.]